MTTATLTKLTEILVQRDAPRPDGKNLWIDIDINGSKSTALMHCQAEEHVGAHTPRMVTFRADQDCVLFFSNPAFFGRDFEPLKAYAQDTLQVITSKGDTSYDVYIGASPADITAAMPKQMATRSGGPHIVVP